MESLMCCDVSFNSIPSSSLNYTFPRPRFLSSLPLINNHRLSLPILRAQQSEASDGSAIGDSKVDTTEWKVRNSQDEIAATQGIRIRRRPPTGPSLHHVGPFEFRLQNEGNTPRNILEEIVWNKDVEVAQVKGKKPLFTLKKAIDNAPPPRDFIGALKASYTRTGRPALIAEVKKASPSQGVLREDFDPVEIAKAYENGGAACISVLTDQKYFQCPLLCKEFIVDAWQLYYARAKGADAVSLIASILPDLDIKYMTKICRMIGLAVLVEVQDENEMDRILKIDGIELIGINNRNLGKKLSSFRTLEPPIMLSSFIVFPWASLYIFHATIAETFEVDISNTKKLLEGERGEKIRQKDITVRCGATI
ncbi:hypothetical protein Ccrd_004770 [Cynara cardunculus var. scolymus]|uniref:indole-3-glycerol-phosphate synthase n=1 Tax=Cynara cardunculus var. scolymus TaxID=59895 RepID=A0A103XLZ2_CYNCS|nr:hypothetical protein Ccrd_004770 [Cynara cardunculus var. scolymus]